MSRFYFLLIAFILFWGGCTEQSEDTVVDVEASDQKMNAAMDHARETVNQFIERLRNPQPNDSEFGIKVKIQDGDNVEHFWVSDISFADGTFTGNLANEPEYVKNVKYGQKITVKSEEISDWKYLDNGKMIGNFTLRVLLEYLPPKQAKAIREQYQIDE
jgi:uncharacterized protein YegJ (DUF2314 family)